MGNIVTERDYQFYVGDLFVYIININKNNFRQTQPFIILLKATFFDQLFIFRCLNKKVLKTMVKIVNGFCELLKMM